MRPEVELGRVVAGIALDLLDLDIRGGEVTFRVPKPCPRCVVTTTDQETGEKGKQPLRALGQQRRFPDGLMFAVNLIPDGVGRIAVGDPVEVL